MNPARKCSRPMCDNSAIATLTYVYADMTAVLGPLATFAEPHCYDLCENHTRRLIPPRGWELVKLETDLDSLKPSSDDLEALADAVREAAGSVPGQHPVHTTGRRGHLRIVRDAD